MMSLEFLLLNFLNFYEACSTINVVSYRNTINIFSMLFTKYDEDWQDDRLIFRVTKNCSITGVVKMRAYSSNFQTRFTQK